MYRSPCRFLFAHLLLLVVALTFTTATVNASPPTHYMNDGGILGYTVFDYTPDAVAQTTVSNKNAAIAASGVTTARWENLKTCRLDVSVPGVVWFLCAYDICHYPPGSPSYCDPYKLAVYPLCSNGGVAAWNGTELYCPPEPDCGGPAP